MSDRTDTIYLGPQEPRCAPAECTMRARCARRLAALPPPPHKSTMAGADSWAGGGTALCTGYVDAAGLRKLQAQPGHRKVHPPLSGDGHG